MQAAMTEGYPGNMATSSKRGKKNNHDTNLDPVTNIDCDDLINRLPEEILYRIISSLPFKSAIETSLVSNQWRRLWKKALLTLVQDAKSEDVVERILGLVQNFDERKEWGSRLDVGQGRILSFAIAPNMTLHVDFSAGDEDKDSTAFNWFMRLKSPSKACGHALQLKSVHLISLNHFSCKAVSSLLSNMPCLRNLTIAKCNGLECLDIFDGSVGLQKLVILDCPDLESVSFEGPDLNSFRYRGKLVAFELKYSGLFRFSDYSDDELYLRDVMLDIRHDNNSVNSPASKKFLSLQSLRYVKCLTICRWIVEDIIYWCMLSFKLRELWWIDNSVNRCNINSLLWFLKHCPSLQRLYVTIDPKICGRSKTRIPRETYNRVRRLRLLKLEGFADENEEIMFIKQLIPFLDTITTIIAKLNGASPWRFIEVPELDQEGQGQFKFEEVKDVHELCNDHVHMKL